LPHPGDGRRKKKKHTTGWQRLAAAVNQAITSTVAPAWAE
jgi:hypothetical protein